MNTSLKQVTAGVIGAAAVGALTLGLAGSANASTLDSTAPAPANSNITAPPPVNSNVVLPPNIHPITGKTALFTIRNYTHQPVRFVGYENNTQAADPGPSLGLAIGPEQSTTFAVDTWTLGGVHTGAMFMSQDGKSNWNVEMRSNALGNEVSCKTNAVCSANGWQPNTTVALYPIVGQSQTS